MPDNTPEPTALAGREAPSKSPDPAPSARATDSLQDVTNIARKLAAHGGGTASLDLAFDLVLHEIVEQARAVSGATGAAIALSRDGKMVCRATTGESAPDLGVSVEAASSLTRTCLKNATIQQCQDTEADPRVDSETCGRLGVRSMLLVPLVDANGAFGVLQLFSSSPNAFGGQEMATLSRLADRVVENRRVVLQSPKPAAMPDDVQVSVPDQLKSEKSNFEPIPEDDVFPTESAITNATELWTAVLFLLVIVAAISLGIVVGWSNGRKAATTSRVPAQSNAGAAERTQSPMNPSTRDGVADYTNSIKISSNSQNEEKSAADPAGSLVVTENGKVIFRSPSGPSNHGPKQSASKPGARVLIHRVEPNYPPDARAQHLEGTVVLNVEIGEDGHVSKAVVASGNPLLASAAVQAVRQWQYEPDSEGRVSQVKIALQFTLPAN